MPEATTTDEDYKPLSARQLASLRGIVDALLPSQSPPPLARRDGTPNNKTTQSLQEDDDVFWTHSLSSDAKYMTVLEQTIQQKLPSTESFLLGWLLYFLSTMVGTILIFGCFSKTSFADFSTREKQTEALLSLQQSSWMEKRKIFNGLKKLVCGLAFSFVYDTTDDEQDKNENTETTTATTTATTTTTTNTNTKRSSVMNPFWKAIGYPGPPQSKLSPEEDASLRMKNNSAKSTKKKKSNNDNKDDDEDDLISNSFVKITKDNHEQQFTYDVIVVGSGAGGSVAAATLAAKGYSVLVLEKGSYVKPSDVSNLEVEAMDQMYESHGLLNTTDGNILMLAGNTLGGGTAINWSCCLPLPDHVRKEWVTKHRLKQFDSQEEFEIATDVIMKRIGCQDKSKVQHNKMNQTLQKGCDNMGYKWDTCAQNIQDTKSDHAGYICFGDRYGNKQSGLNVFLTDAVNSGARIMENCHVEQVVQGLYKSPTGKQRSRAMGVIAHVGEYKIQIKAKRCVIVSAGALNTPRLLHRSWLRNEHIGRHLRLHPTIVAAGFYDNPIDCYLGAPLTTVCNEFQHGPKENGYGAKIECPSCHTGLAAVGTPYLDPKHFKEAMLKSRHGAPLICIQRDTGEGKILLGEEELKIDYKVSKADRESLMESMKACVKLLIASGANEIRTSRMNDGGFKLSNDNKKNSNGTTPTKTRDEIENDPKIQQYLTDLERRGLEDHKDLFMCAHQMGSCRMALTPEKGVVDENGETWECDDLFVFDTSIFPTASGSNPMLTCFAISRMLSIRLWMRFQNDENKLTQNAQLARAMTTLRVSRLRIRQKTPTWHKVGDWFFFGLMATLIIYFNFFWDYDSFNEAKSSLSSSVLDNENSGIASEL